MAVKTIPDKAKRSCVARIKGGLARGKNTVQQEALKMGVSPQAVRKWCRDLGLNTRESVPAAPVKLEAEPIDDPSSPVPPRKPAAAGDASPSADGGAQDKALEAAGLGAGGKPKEPGAKPEPIGHQEQEREYQRAKQEDIDLCLDLFDGLKEEVVGDVGHFVLGIPEEDPDLKKVSHLARFTQRVVKVNASIIAPDLERTVQQGWDAVGPALLLDLAISVGALFEIRRKYKKLEEKPPEPSPGDRAPAPKEERRTEPDLPGNVPPTTKVHVPDGKEPPPPCPGAVVLR